MEQTRALGTFRRALPTEAQHLTTDQVIQDALPIEQEPAIKPRPQPKSFMVEPFFVPQLVNLIGISKAAEELGYDVSTVQTNLRNGEIRQTTEKLARFLLDAAKERAEKPQLMCASIPAEKLSGFKLVCAAMGIKISLLEV